MDKEENYVNNNSEEDTEAVVGIKKEISELQRILNFIEKVIDYGLPDMNADDLSSDGMTMAEMAGIFSERI